MAGINLVIEGPDGSGKSTLAAELQKRIPNSVLARHPGSTVLGKNIRKMIKYDKEIKLSSYVEQVALALDLCDFIDKILIPNINNEVTVVSDRSNLISGMVYALAGGVDMKMIKQFQNISLAMNPPKMHVIVLDAKREELMVRRVNRGKMDKFEMMDHGFHDHVCANYALLSRACEPMLSRCREFVEMDGKSIYRIDATLSMDVVLEKAIKIYKHLLSSYY